MTDTNEKNRDMYQNNQIADTATQEEHTAEPRIGEMPRRNHKDSTFCLLFSEPARAIELYNAVTGENLPPGQKNFAAAFIPGKSYSVLK